MNDNVEVADKLVKRIRHILVQTEGKKIIPIKTEELIDYLQSMERLAVLERHLVNLCSDGYKVYASA
jgi:hypothetical protein